MIKFKKNNQGEYEAGNIAIFKKEENDGFGTWRMTVDGEWHNDFYTLKEAKAAALSLTD